MLGLLAGGDGGTEEGTGYRWQHVATQQVHSRYYTYLSHTSCRDIGFVNPTYKSKFCFLDKNCHFVLLQAIKVDLFHKIF